jgi:putative spermidine/putrescine transport system permease protein
MLRRIGIAAFAGLGALAVVVATPALVLLLYSVSGGWQSGAVFPAELTLEWYAYIVRYENALPALTLSLRIAAVTAFVALLVGAPAGYALARLPVPGRQVIELMFLAKTATPVIVVGVGTAVVFLRAGLTDTFAGIVAAHLVGALPLMIWSAASAFRAIDPALEEAAHDAGAGAFRTFLLVTLPLARPGLTAGALLAFIYSLDEFAITFLISGVEYTTLPLRLYSTLQQGYIEPAAAASVLLVAPSVVLIALVLRIVRLTDLGAAQGHAG